MKTVTSQCKHSEQLRMFQSLLSDDRIDEKVP